MRLTSAILPEEKDGRYAVSGWCLPLLVKAKADSDRRGNSPHGIPTSLSILPERL